MISEHLFSRRFLSELRKRHEIAPLSDPATRLFHVKFGVINDPAPKMHKGPHDVDIYVNGLVTIE